MILYRITNNNAEAVVLRADYRSHKELPAGGSIVGYAPLAAAPANIVCEPWCSAQLLAAFQMPAPDALVECRNGDLVAAMFYFAAAEQRLDHIADEQGFDLMAVSFDGDRAMDDDHPLMKRHEAGESVTDDWLPPAPDGGWQFAGKDENEDGPFALFIRRKNKGAAA